MAQFYPSRWTTQEGTLYLIRINGAGAANPVKLEGEGVVITRTGAGVYRVQWAENPFQFIGAIPGFQATTPAGVARWSCVVGDYDASLFRLPLNIFASDGTTATDLAAGQKLTVAAYFARTGY